MAPTASRSSVEDELRVLRTELNETTIPPFENSAEHFGLTAMNAKETKDLDKLFRSRLSKDLGEDKMYVSAVLKQLKNSVELLTMIEDNLEKYFSKDVAKASVTYSQMNIMRMIDLIAFNAKYARKLLLWTFQKEQEALGQRIDSPFTKTEVNWLFENRPLFFSSVKTLSKDVDKVKVLIRNIPNIVIDVKDNEEVEASVDSNKLDPFNMGFIPLAINPVYHIGRLVAEWQAARYDASIEERRALEYRLIMLKELGNGKRDAKLEKEIEYIETRVKKLNYKISKYEDD